MLHFSSRSCAGTRRASLFPLVGFAAGCLCATSVVAQALPPLEATVSYDDLTYGSELMGSNGFVYVRCTTTPSGGGIWYRGLAGAAILDEGYFEDDGLAAMRPAMVRLGSIANNFPPALEPPWGTPYTDSLWDIHAHPATVTSTLASLLQDPAGLPSPNGPELDAVPLLFAPTQIVHDYHDAPFSLHGWKKESDGAFNLDALRQTAIWTAVASTVGGTEDDFFNDQNDAYAKICKYPVQVSISLIGVRSPSVVPETVTAPPVPLLQGYPVAAPKLTRSGPALVTYAGTSSTWLAFSPPGGGFTPIFPVQAGGTVQLPAAGYAPGMQVAVFSMSASPSQRFDLNVLWCGFGQVALTMASAAAPGIFEVRYCRYLVPGPGGTTFGTWREIPSGERVHLLVTP